MLLQAFETFEARDGHTGAAAPAVSGRIERYDLEQITRLAPTGTLNVQSASPATDVYRDGDNLWVVDERWGIARLRILARSFDIWLLDQPVMPFERVFDVAIMQTLSQMLRHVHLIPGAAVVRSGHAILLLGIEHHDGLVPLLARLGFRVIAQRWTVVRLLPAAAQLMPTGVPTLDEADRWHDVCATPGVSHRGANATQVIILKRFRQDVSFMAPAKVEQAMEMMRQQWPVPEVHPAQRTRQLIRRLAESCRCFEAAGSANMRDIASLLSSMELPLPKAGPTPLVTQASGVRGVSSDGQGGGRGPRALVSVLPAALGVLRRARSA